MNHLRTSQVIKLYVLVHSTRWISGIKWRDYYYFLICLSKRTNEWTGQVRHFHIYGQFFCWEGRPPNLHAPWAQPQNIHTNDSITSLQASRIMSCGITVSPSGNHLPVHTGSTGLEWLWLRRRCCTTAAAKFHQGEEAFSSTSSQTICVSRGRKTKTAVWQETFLPFQEPSQLSWKLRSLSLWQRRGWQNKLFEETHRSNLDMTAKTGHKCLMDFIR